MTPKLTIRSFTSDQFVLDKVFYSNYYKLRGTKVETEKPVVVDIGAHCGYFTFAALSLGAKKVYSFEPFVPNYAVLLQNVFDTSIGKVIPYQLGVRTLSDIGIISLAYPKSNGSYFELAYVSPDIKDQNFYRNPAVSLDELLSSYVYDNVDVLKISIGYAEANILVTASSLQKKVKYICGETVMEENKIDEFKANMLTKGFLHAHVAKVEDSGDDDRIMFIFGQDELAKRFKVK